MSGFKPAALSPSQAITSLKRLPLCPKRPATPLLPMYSAETFRIRTVPGWPFQAVFPQRMSCLLWVSIFGIWPASSPWETWSSKTPPARWCIPWPRMKNSPWAAVAAWCAKASGSFTISANIPILSPPFPARLSRPGSSLALYMRQVKTGCCLVSPSAPRR